MRIELALLPQWPGGILAAEYDAEEDVIRLNRRAVEAIRTALGEDAAQDFVACALAHELSHRTGGASEVQAHAFAREVSGIDPARFEAVLRARRDCA